VLPSNLGAEKLGRLRFDAYCIFSAVWAKNPYLAGNLEQEGRQEEAVELPAEFAEQVQGMNPACRVSPRETRRVRPMPPGTRGMATTLFVPRPPCGRSGDSTTHQPSPTAPTNGWTGCRMPLQILSAGSGIQHPLRHYDNPYGLYPCLGLPASA